MGRVFYFEILMERFRRLKIGFFLFFIYVFKIGIALVVRRRVFVSFRGGGCEAGAFVVLFFEFRCGEGVFDFEFVFRVLIRVDVLE